MKPLLDRINIAAQRMYKYKGMCPFLISETEDLFPEQIKYRFVCPAYCGLCKIIFPETNLRFFSCYILGYGKVNLKSGACPCFTLGYDNTKEIFNYLFPKKEKL